MSRVRRIFVRARILSVLAPKLRCTRTNREDGTCERNGHTSLRRRDTILYCISFLCTFPRDVIARHILYDFRRKRSIYIGIIKYRNEDVAFSIADVVPHPWGRQSGGISWPSRTIRMYIWVNDNAPPLFSLSSYLGFDIDIIYSFPPKRFPTNPSARSAWP